MRNLVVLVSGFVSILVFVSKAEACGPWLCVPQYCLTYGQVTTSGDTYNTCRPSGVDHLDPGNWTESNASILAAELAGGKPEKEDPYSNSADQGEDVAALPHDAFRSGIESFRKSDYGNAAASFLSSYKGKNNPEKSLYYLGRSMLVQSQSDWDGYFQPGGDNESIDHATAQVAFEYFQDFVKKYPDHEWANSAEGLMRRSALFSRGTKGYFRAWSKTADRLLAQRPRNYQALSNLLIETSSFPVDYWVQRTDLHPMLWVLRAYYVTRKYPKELSPSVDETKPKKEYSVDKELAALEKARGSFKKYPDLFAWSKAVLLLKASKFEEGYTLLQKQSVAKTNQGSLSWLVLNARLLMGMKKYDEARALIARYIETKPIPKPPSYGDEYPRREASLNARQFYAMTYVWENKVEALVSDENLKRLGAEMFVSVAAEALTPKTALSVLKKELNAETRKVIEPVAVTKVIVARDWTTGAELGDLLKDPEARKRVGPLAAAAKTLLTNPKDAESLARVGIFLTEIPNSQVTYARCENQVFVESELKSPMVIMQESLASFKDEEKAKAKKNPIESQLLKTMLHCFRTRHSEPYCDGPGDVEVKTKERGAWFKRLHSRFPDSEEAKNQSVYW